MNESTNVSEEREHADKCPNQPDVGYVFANIKCPECGVHGYHPTRQCSSCGYALCWCVVEEDE